MRATIILITLVFVAGRVDSQFWKYPQQFLNNFSWLRQAKTGSASLNPNTSTPDPPRSANTTAPPTSTFVTDASPKNTAAQSVERFNVTRAALKRVTKTNGTTAATTIKQTTLRTGSTATMTTSSSSEPSSSATTARRTTTGATATTDASTLPDSTTQEVTGTTEEPRDNHRVHDFYLSKREKPQVKIASNISQVSRHRLANYYRHIYNTIRACN